MGKCNQGVIQLLDNIIKFISIVIEHVLNISWKLMIQYLMLSIITTHAQTIYNLINCISYAPLKIDVFDQQKVKFKTSIMKNNPQMVYLLFWLFLLYCEHCILTFLVFLLFSNIPKY